MAYDFSDAGVKLGRADELLSNLASGWATHQDAHPMSGFGVVGWQEAPGGDYMVRITPEPFPDDLKGLLGEFANALRTSLNYLVFVLARSDSGKAQKGTQFPIVESNQEFVRLASKHLKGVDAANVALIEARQPYNGNDWLKLVRDLSNVGKHKHLNVVITDVETTWNVYTVRHSESAKQHAKAIDEGVTDMDVDMNVHLGLRIRIAIPDGSLDGAPFIPTLEQLLTQTKQLIEAFQALP